MEAVTDFDFDGSVGEIEKRKEELKRAAVSAE